jgi:ABC-type branched-subunit amino acid transport system substrate-binding protein
MQDPTLEERAVHGAFRAVVAAAAVVVALSTFYVAPRLTSRTAGTAARSQGAGGAEQGLTSGTVGGRADTAGNESTGAGQSGPAGDGGGGTVNPAGLSCSGNNGGKTDVGIDARDIYLAATEVESGIGQSFLGPVRYGMLAVLQKVNRQGGVCQRQLHLTLKDDGWRPDVGKQYLDNFIDSNQYFALTVVPSSEGLNAASTGGDIDNVEDPLTGGRGIPVVGTDGMLNSQYSDPLIWPVAASTATSMRIMAHDAAMRGRSLGHPVHMGIVYDVNYRFGPEGAGAFVAQAGRDGAKVVQRCEVPLTAGESGYGTQIKQFNDDCGEGGPDQVDFVALLMEPQTAETWLSGGPYLGSTSTGQGLGFGGPQPLFDKNFGDTCGQICQNMEVWTSFYPPIYPFDQRSEVQIFKQDLCAVDNQCAVDALSAFTEGGYVGVELLVDALRATSPDLTRARLQAKLDTMRLNAGLSGPLAWKPGFHYANETMVAFKDAYSGGSSSFQPINGGSPESDPCPGCPDKPLSS